jgi:uncharacterized protein YbjT (DUF2867 family)
LKICVFGGTGLTGSNVIRVAIMKGYEVVALARRPEVLRTQFPNIEVVQGDVYNAETIRTAIKDSDAVISTIGPSRRTLRANLVPASRKRTNIYSEGVINIAKAMEEMGKRRLIVTVSLIGIDPQPDASWYALAIRKNILIPLLGYQYRDSKMMMDKLIKLQGLDWTIVGLARLTGRKPKGHYRSSIGTPIHHPSDINHSDLADYLVSIISEPQTYNQWTEVSW